MGEKGNAPAEAASLLERASATGGALAGIAGTKAVEVGVEAGVGNLTRSKDEDGTSKDETDDDPAE